MLGNGHAGSSPSHALSSCPLLMSVFPCPLPRPATPFPPFFPGVSRCSTVHVLHDGVAALRGRRAVRPRRQPRPGRRGLPVRAVHRCVSRSDSAPPSPPGQQRRAPLSLTLCCSAPSSLADVRELVTLDDVVAETDLGPNGGLIRCLEHLTDNLDWLEEHVGQFSDDYLIIDCPGPCSAGEHAVGRARTRGAGQNAGGAVSTRAAGEQTWAGPERMERARARRRASTHIRLPSSNQRTRPTPSRPRPNRAVHALSHHAPDQGRARALGLPRLRRLPHRCAVCRGLCAGPREVLRGACAAYQHSTRVCPFALAPGPGQVLRWNADRAVDHDPAGSPPHQRSVQDGPVQPPAARRHSPVWPCAPAWPLRARATNMRPAAGRL